MEWSPSAADPAPLVCKARCSGRPCSGSLPVCSWTSGLVIPGGISRHKVIDMYRTYACGLCRVGALIRGVVSIGRVPHKRHGLYWEGAQGVVSIEREPHKRGGLYWEGASYIGWSLIRAGVCLEQRCPRQQVTMLGRSPKGMQWPNKRQTHTERVFSLMHWSHPHKPGGLSLEVVT